MKKLVTLLLILSLAVLPLTGCSLFGKKTLEFKPSKVTFQALSYTFDENGKGIGKAHDIVVDIKKNTEKKIKIGFYEDEVAGTGDMWKAAGWSAALATSLLLNVNLADYEIAYTLTGKTDGPSAGAALTVATMASLLGHKIKKDAVMTGTINIDGSIGPVGGIAQKIEGAKEAGKKLVLIPTGQRFSQDLNTQQMVDVVDKGDDLGLTVKPVSDIYEAYKLLVGKPLPKPKVSDDDDPELPETSTDQVKAKANEWNSRYTDSANNFKKLSMLMRRQFNSIAVSTDAIMDSSDKHYNEGSFATSYGEATQAVARLDMTYAAAKVGDAALGAALSGEQGSLDAAAAEAKTFSTASSRLDSLYTRLKEEKPDSLGDSLAIANAYGAVWEATGLEDISKAYASRGGKYADRLQNTMMSAFYSASMPNYVEYAEDFLEIGMDNKGAPAPNVSKVEALGEILRRAADANLNVFETVVLNERAKEKNMTEDDYRWVFMNYEIYYAQARALMRYIDDNIKRTAKKKSSSSYATLGAAMSSYLYSSYLNAKYYALQAQVDADGNITSVGREKALTDMLDYNLDRTKENIAIAKKAGGLSAFPIISYEKSKVAREGSVGQKVESLLDSWRASLEAQVMTMLSGRLRLSPSGKDGEFEMGTRGRRFKPDAG